MPGTQTTAEDTPRAITGLAISDVDAGTSSMTVTLAVTIGTLTVSGGSAAIAGSGTSTVVLTGTVAQINATLAATVTFVPGANFNGSATLTMTTSDNGNSGAGGVLTDIDTVAITVTPVNDAPVLSATANPAAVAEAASASAQNLAPISGSFAVIDVDVGDTLTASVVGSPTVQLDGASFVLPASASALIAAGAFRLTSPGLSTGASQSVGYTYDPAAANLDFLRAGQSLTITYAVRVSDGAVVSATQTVTFTITGTNDAPVAQAASFTVAEDAALVNGSVIATDADTGAVLTYSLIGPAPAGLSFNSSGGGYSFDPSHAAYQSLAVGQSTVLTVPYQVVDGLGGVGTANLVITVTGTNDAPVANADTASTNEDVALTLTPAALLANDTDVDSGATLTMTSVQGAVNGSVALVAGNAVFTPSAHYSGPASFTYTVTDGQGASATASVNVTVVAVADAPSLITASQVFSLVAGGVSIRTKPGMTQANLEAMLGLPAGQLDTFDPPPGTAPVSTSDPGAVDVFDGRATNYTLGLGSGQIASFAWSFINGQALSSEINDGYNDVVVLVVTNPAGVRQYVQVTSSEQTGPNINGAAADASGTYQFTATTSGEYQFAWLVLNARDGGKDSSITVATPTVTVGATAYGVPVPLWIGAGLTDTDGSESLSFRVSGVPAGAAFSAGTNLGGGVWSFTPAQASGLNLLPPAGFTGTVNLSVSALATEASNGATATTTQTVAVTIEATSTSTMGTQNGETMNGAAGNDQLQGFAGNDVLNGNDGNDLLYGSAGDDTLNGGNGNDVLNGGAGNDILSGGAGNDLLIGGAGNDTLTGGAGADVFAWRFADRGAAGTPAVDQVTDFNSTPPASGSGDVLDLRDLLQGETTSLTLDRYLDFNVSGGNTEIRISSSGGFTGGGYVSGTEDQRIVLQGVDIRASLGLTGSATDFQIIAELINRGKLVTDVPPGG